MSRRFSNKGVCLAAKWAFRALVVCTFLFGSLSKATAQDLVQAAVDGLMDGQHAHDASQLIQQRPDVLMARFDVHTRNMMLHVQENSTLSKDQINALLAPLGVQLRCYSRRAASAAPFRHVDADRCGTPSPSER